MAQQLTDGAQTSLYDLAAIAAGEQYCQELTRREARNFYWGFLALPKRQRIAIYALYSFSRQVDDQVDLNGDHGLAMIACRRQRARIDSCYAAGEAEPVGDEPHDPVIDVLRRVVEEHSIPRDELLALVRGVEMDLETRRYDTWHELETYTNHVASAVGRMTTRIFGFSDPVALEHAAALGTALQITNILRDVREDFELGRIYVPREDLDRFHLSEANLALSDPGPGWPPLVRFEVARARRYYDEGLKITGFIPRRAAACVLTMSGLYARILSQIDDDPYLPLRQRARLRKRTKLKVMLGSWLRAV